MLTDRKSMLIWAFCTFFVLKVGNKRQKSSCSMPHRRPFFLRNHLFERMDYLRPKVGLRRARAAIMLKNMPFFLLFSRAIYRYKSPKWARTNIERLALSQLHVLGIGCGKRTPFAQRIAFTFVSQVWQGLRVLPFLRVRIYASSG